MRINLSEWIVRAQDMMNAICWHRMHNRIEINRTIIEFNAYHMINRECDQCSNGIDDTDEPTLVALFMRYLNVRKTLRMNFTSVPEHFKWIGFLWIGSVCFLLMIELRLLWRWPLSIITSRYWQSASVHTHDHVHHFISHSKHSYLDQINSNSSIESLIHAQWVTSRYTVQSNKWQMFPKTKPIVCYFMRLALLLFMQIHRRKPLFIFFSSFFRAAHRMNQFDYPKKICSQLIDENPYSVNMFCFSIVCSLCWILLGFFPLQTS